MKKHITLDKMKSLHKSTNQLKKITQKKNGQKTSVALTKEDIYLVNKYRSNCLSIIRKQKYKWQNIIIYTPE